MLKKAIQLREVKINTELRDEIFRIVENQLKADKPEETRRTYKRLIGNGYSEVEAKQLIGQCVAVEIFSVLKEQKPFNERRYVENLNQLPKPPFD